MKSRACALAVVIVSFAFACASPPKATPAARRLFSNGRAVVEGRVVDRAGRPVSGIGVAAIPRGRDIEWSPAATTDSDGFFKLTLFAPAEYAFLLSRAGKTVITEEPDDPSRTVVAVGPGDRRTGLQLHFLESQWKAAAD